MSKYYHPLEKSVNAVVYKGVEFEVVERPDVLWVGCVDFAADNTGESDIGGTLKRFREINGIAKKDLINPDWSAALSINYKCADKPCGIMFANETYSDEQDARFDLFTQPGGLWLRVGNDMYAAKLLLGKEKAETYEYFGPLESAAKENGYIQNPDINLEVEYHCHAEYNSLNHKNYAYIPVIRA